MLDFWFKKEKKKNVCCCGQVFKIKNIFYFLYFCFKQIYFLFLFLYFPLLNNCNFHWQAIWFFFVLRVDGGLTKSFNRFEAKIWSVSCQALGDSDTLVAAAREGRDSETWNASHTKVTKSITTLAALMAGHHQHFLWIYLTYRLSSGGAMGCWFCSRLGGRYFRDLLLDQLRCFLFYSFRLLGWGEILLSSWCFFASCPCFYYLLFIFILYNI